MNPSGSYNQHIALLFGCLLVASTAAAVCLSLAALLLLLLSYEAEILLKENNDQSKTITVRLIALLLITGKNYTKLPLSN